MTALATLIGGIDVRWFAEAGYQIVDIAGFTRLDYFSVTLRNPKGQDLTAQVDGPTLDAAWAVLGRVKTKSELATAETEGHRLWESFDQSQWVVVSGELFEAWVAGIPEPLMVGDFASLDEAIAAAMEQTSLSMESARRLVEEDSRGFQPGQEG